MSEYDLKKLKECIINLSEAESWKESKTEWQIVDTVYLNSPQNCLCGHSEVFEMYVIKNLKNDRTAKVGVVCKNKFMDNVPEEIAFESFREVSNNPEVALNAAAACYAYQRNWTTEFEFNFLTDLCDKMYSELRGNQQPKRIEINRIVLWKVPSEILITKE